MSENLYRNASSTGTRLQSVVDNFISFCCSLVEIPFHDIPELLKYMSVRNLGCGQLQRWRMADKTTYPELNHPTNAILPFQMISRDYEISTVRFRVHDADQICGGHSRVDTQFTDDVLTKLLSGLLLATATCTCRIVPISRVVRSSGHLEKVQVLVPIHSSTVHRLHV